MTILVSYSWPENYLPFAATSKVELTQTIATAPSIWRVRLKINYAHNVVYYTYLSRCFSGL
jgi:hypothetical protein